MASEAICARVARRWATRLVQSPTDSDNYMKKQLLLLAVAVPALWFVPRAEAAPQLYGTCDCATSLLYDTWNGFLKNCDQSVDTTIVDEPGKCPRFIPTDECLTPYDDCDVIVKFKRVQSDPLFGGCSCPTYYTYSEEADCGQNSDITVNCGFDYQLECGPCGED